MPKFIPNQPITFGNVTQPCLNNDNRSYAMLMQGQDKWKLQIENTPCDGEEGSVCDRDMNDVGGYLVNSEFTNISEWSLIDSSIFPTFGFVEINVDAGSNNEGIIYKSIVNPNNCGSPTWKTYKLTFEISQIFIQNNSACTFQISSDFGTYNDNSIVLYTGLPIVGINEMYVQLSSVNSYITILLSGTNNDYVRLNSFKLQEVAECWSCDGDINNIGGVGAISQPAWTYSQLGGNGFFTSVPYWDTWNARSFPVSTLSVCLNSTLSIGDALRLTYRISNQTAGSIYPMLGTQAGVIRYSNGTFSEIIISDMSINYIDFWTDKEFDGTISIVEGYVYANCHTFDVINADTGENAATGYVPNYIGNKIEMVFNPQSIPGEVGGEPNDFELKTGCYQIRFNDCCTGESYLSDTVINYTTDTHECTVLVDATCDDQAFGFDFSNQFSLSQRLRLLRFNPIYKNEGEDSQGSDGVKRRPFARSEKVYNCIFDYCDEPTHDAINTQLLCDNLTLDGVEYFCPIKDYQPEWSDRGKLNLAQSQVELQTKQSVIYNRNCI